MLSFLFLIFAIAVPGECLEVAKMEKELPVGELWEQGTIVRVGRFYAFARTSTGEEIFLHTSELRIVLKNGDEIFQIPPPTLRTYIYGATVSFKRVKPIPKPDGTTPPRDKTSIWVYTHNLATGELPKPVPFYRLIRRRYNRKGIQLGKGDIVWTGYQVNLSQVNKYWNLKKNPYGESITKRGRRTTYGFDIYLDGQWHSCPDPRQAPQ